MKKFLVGLICVAATAVMIMGSVYGADAGSEADPLVSKSYVDDKIEQVLAQIGQGSGSTSSASSTFTPVSVAVGKTIIGGEGTEMILRAGKAGVVISGSEGITDATTGQTLYNGHSASLNHLTIIPRADGRGFKVTEAAWFMVKGSYTIN